MSSLRRCALALLGGAVLTPTAPLRAFPAPLVEMNVGGETGRVLPCGAPAQPIRSAAAGGPVFSPADSTLAALHASGQSFSDFVAAAKARREGWLRLADSAQVDGALVQRARAVGGSWKLLVVAERASAGGKASGSVPLGAMVVRESWSIRYVCAAKPAPAGVTGLGVLKVGLGPAAGSNMVK